jgi:hypothetical protein
MAVLSKHYTELISLSEVALLPQFRIGVPFDLVHLFPVVPVHVASQGSEAVLGTAILEGGEERGSPVAVAAFQVFGFSHSAVLSGGITPLSVGLNPPFTELLAKIGRKCAKKNTTEERSDNPLCW